MNRHLLPLFACAVLAVSCAHSTASSEGASASQAAAAAEDNSPLVTPEQTPWAQMSKQQRGRYMMKVVMPKMRDLFQAHDPKHFEKVTCGTCHGKNPKAVEFRMPSPDLPSLPDSPEVFMATVMKEKPEMVKFMGEQVAPTMAQLLGLKHFDPAHPEPGAFSCNGCHTLKPSKPKS